MEHQEAKNPDMAQLVLVFGCGEFFVIEANIVYAETIGILVSDTLQFRRADLRKGVGIAAERTQWATMLAMSFMPRNGNVTSGGSLSLPTIFPTRQGSPSWSRVVLFPGTY